MKAQNDKTPSRGSCGSRGESVLLTLRAINGEHSTASNQKNQPLVVRLSGAVQIRPGARRTVCLGLTDRGAQTSPEASGAVKSSGLSCQSPSILGCVLDGSIRHEVLDPSISAGGRGVLLPQDTPPAA